MDIETLGLKIAEFKGEMKAFRELFGQHTTQDMTQFTALAETLKEIDSKVDKILIREATRTGELAGVRRSSIMIASIVSLALSLGFRFLA